MADINTPNSVQESSTAGIAYRTSRAHPLHRISFSSSNFLAMHRWDMASQNLFITKMVTSTRCLQELSISMSQDIEFAPTAVAAWLMHARTTLRSLVFENHIVPQMSLLDKLGGTQSVLENLQWRYACIPTINPSTHIFPALVRLVLKATDLHNPQNLEMLLISCPKLEVLFLKNTCFLEHSHMRSMELHSSSLKMFYAQKGLNGIDNLVLHAQNLRVLRIKDTHLKLFELVQGKGNHIGFAEMSICNANIATLHLGEAVQSLVQVQVAMGDSTAVEKWGNIYEGISKASNLKELRIHNMSIFAGRCVDINKLALSFPQICLLELDYENASDAFTEFSPKFERLRVLVLNVKTKLQYIFTKWVACFLEKCPGLRRLEICLNDFKDETDTNENRLLRKFTSSIIQIGRLHPHIDVDVTFYNEWCHLDC